MARISSRPWMEPSSPGRPWRRLRAASGFAAASAAATLRSTSMRVTRRPWRSSASAQDLPERSDTSRSADHPPISTATCLVIVLPHPEFGASPPPPLGGGGGRGGAGFGAITPLPHACVPPPSPPLPRRGGRGRACIFGNQSRRQPDALDLPFQLHAGIFLHPRP